MRTIRFEEEFSQQIARLRISSKRLDDALENLLDVVGNSPDLFPEVPGTPLRRIRLTEVPGMPSLTIFFLFDEETVYLISAELLGGS